MSEPALTDEQIDNMTVTFRDAYLRTLPTFGHPVGKDLFDRWYAAVIARAKREEWERIILAGWPQFRLAQLTCDDQGPDCTFCRGIDQAAVFFMEVIEGRHMAEQVLDAVTPERRKWLALKEDADE